ncbi:MAG: transposase [Actinomycetota bacterium]
MSRPLRIQFPGAVYHVTARGNAKQEIFISKDDRWLFLEVVARAAKQYSIVIHAYCLMPNHYHLLIETPYGNLSEAMRHINQLYTQCFNKRHDRVGHVFQGRFKAVLVEKDQHLLELSRYIVNNPIRAGLAAKAADYYWSSHKQTAGLIAPQPWLSVDWIRSQFGDDAKLACHRYRMFVEDYPAATNEVSPEHDLPIGGDIFIARLADYVWEKDEVKAISGRERMLGRPPIEALFQGVSDRATRNQKIREACIDFGYSQCEIAKFLGMHPNSISRFLKT